MFAARFIPNPDLVSPLHFLNIVPESAEMPVLFLTDDQVHGLLDIQQSIEIVEECFVALHEKRAANVPRSRIGMPGLLLHCMSASAQYLEVAGWKNYTTTREGARFQVGLHDGKTGELLCLIDANRLGQLRTGAATGVAVKHLTTAGNAEVAIIGTGYQAETQLSAICAVRSVSEARVFSRNAENREAFAERMAAQLAINVRAVESVDAAIDAAAIVVTATTSPTPVLNGSGLADSTLVAAIGGNQSSRTELDGTTLERSRTVIVDDVTQCQIEAGELIGGVKAGLCRWEDMRSLGSVIADESGFEPPEQGLTLFKTVGLAIQDVAMAHCLFRLAQERSIGQELPF